VKCAIHNEEYPEGLECRSCVAGLPPKEEPTDTLRNPQHKPWCACNAKGLRMCDCGLVPKEPVDVWKVECKHCHHFTEVRREDALEVFAPDLLTAARDLLEDLESLHDKWDARGGQSGSDKYEDALYTCINELADVIIKHRKAVKAKSI